MWRWSQYGGDRGTEGQRALGDVWLPPHVQNQDGDEERGADLSRFLGREFWATQEPGWGIAFLLVPWPRPVSLCSHDFWVGSRINGVSLGSLQDLEASRTVVGKGQLWR